MRSQKKRTAIQRLSCARGDRGYRRRVLRSIMGVLALPATLADVARFKPRCAVRGMISILPGFRVFPRKPQDIETLCRGLLPSRQSP
jgi:hypothetical protein